MVYKNFESKKYKFGDYYSDARCLPSQTTSWVKGLTKLKGLVILIS